MSDVPGALGELISRLSPENRAALAGALAGPPEPIAVIGIGCRLPGAADPESFWRLLVEGVDAVGEVPPDRPQVGRVFDPDVAAPGRSYSRWGGFLERIDEFDPHFFGISPREAEGLDPQQRLLLEVSFETLENAGRDVKRLAGSDTGVFVGLSTHDYFQLGVGDLARVDPYATTGAMGAMAAGRIAYTWDLRGPTVVVDSVCSSSLVAVHLAVRSLRTRECGLALAGGVNVIAAPWGMVAGSKLGALSPSGRCRTFDEGADGFVRGEGCGVVALRRLADALADGDEVLAVIRGTAVNHDGRSNGLMAPNLAAQRALLEAALADARLGPDEIDLIEAHGTGTPLGDPIEVEALRAVFGGERTREPLRVTAVKTNIGHLEAAAGVASLIKAILAVGRGDVPPHLHLSKLNPRIGAFPFHVPSALEPWPAGDGPRRAGVSSFGMSGTNAHVIVEEPPPRSAPEPARHGPPFLVPVSAHDGPTLRALAGAYADLLVGPDAPHPADVAYSAWRRRTHHPFRAAAIGQDAEALSSALRRIASGEPGPGVVVGEALGTADDEMALRATAAAQTALEALGREPGGGANGSARRVDRPTLEAVARAYVLGAELDPRPIAPKGRFVRLPMYPWQRRRYWLATAQTHAPAPPVRGAPSADPHRPGDLLGERVEVGAHPELALFEQELRADQLPPLTEHRVQGRVVVPGSGLAATLWAAARAAARADANAPVALRGLRFEQFLAFEDGAARRLQTLVEGGRLSLLGRPADASPGEAWVTHASARVGKIGDLGGPSAALEPLEGVRARCTERIRPEAHYADFASLGIELGPSFRAFREILRGAGEALIEIEVPAAEGSGPFGEETVLLDACFQSLYHSIDSAEGTFVPLEVDTLAIHAPLVGAGPVYCHARFRHAGARSRTGDIQARDASGRLLLEATGVTAFQVAERPVRATAPALPLHEVAWRERALTAARPEAHAGWILVSDGGGVTDALARALERRGETVTTLLTPVLRPGWEGALSAALEGLARPCRGVVHLAALDATDPGRTHHDARAVATSAVTLANALDGPDAPRLYFVTRGAVPADALGPMTPAQATLWGVARCLAGERPRLRTTLVDLDPGGGSDSGSDDGPGDGPGDGPDGAAPLVDALLEELLAGEDERYVAFRRGTRRVARLAERTSRSSAGAFEVRPDGTYLITGGLGGLGLATAAWLVGRGARHLALVGRSAPGAPTLAEVDALRAETGAEVHIHAADVSSEDAVRALLTDLAARQPPLAGIVHAAGVLDDAPLGRQDAARIGRVFAPKVDGAWWLHRLTEGPAAPWIVFFSSASSVLEAPGQAGYAAANAFLDGFAHFLTRRGRPALSVSWGAWSEVGMAAERDAGLYRGMRLSPADALALLGRLLEEGGPHAVAMAFDARTWRARFPDAVRGPFLDELRSGGVDAAAVDAATPGGGGGGALGERVRSAPEAERQGRLAEVLRDEVCRALRLEPERVRPRTPFGELGLDSIMAIEIKNRLEAGLGLTLPATLLFTEPTLSALTDHLSERMGLVEATPAVGPVADEHVEAVRLLDRDAARALLESELDEMERLLGES